MLEKLQQIVQRVSDVEDVGIALKTIVQSVKKIMTVDQCSIFLANTETQQLILTETEGLDPAAIGTVSLAPGEGLVGYVAEQRRPVTIVNAAEHPKFKYFPVTGESRYKTFLGVPVVHLRKVVGVLVVQTVGDRPFNEEDEAFLVTISAQLAGIVHGAGIVQQLQASNCQSGQMHIQGVPGAPGVAVGTAILPSPLASLDQVKDRADTDPQSEERRFRQAIIAATAELAEAGERLGKFLPEETQALFHVYIQITNDEVVITKTVARIHAGQWAPAALRDTIDELSAVFDGMSDERLSSRGEDVRAVGRRILLQLQPDYRESTDYPARCILVGEEVSVARLSHIPREKLAGIICFAGSTLSHTAILAKSLGIPAVMGLGKIPLASFGTGPIIVDGYQGRVVVNPIAAVLSEYHRLEREELDLASTLREHESLPAKTLDNRKISVQANIALLSDVDLACRAGADGVGLYRSELPFMLRESFPVEDQQLGIYRRVLEAFAPRPVVMRTLDIGGDKPLPYFPLHDNNPALGWRGVRISLNHPEIFVTQIRAMLRANVGLGNLRIMLPMISTASELKEARVVIEQAAADLQNEGISATLPPIGTMVEVPSLIFQIPALAEQAAFFSIGTNDLTQYLMAADRDNPKVADLYDHLQPAVLIAIQHIVEAVRKTGKKVTVCGELASDPGGVLLLLAMGIDNLSVSTSAFARVKWVIRNFSADSAQLLLNEAVKQSDPNGVRQLLNAALEDMGLGGLVRAGK